MSISLEIGCEDPETRLYISEYFGQTLKYFVNVSKGGENPFKKPLDAVLPHWTEIAMQRYDYRIRPEEFLELSPGEGFIAVGDKHIIGVKAKLQYFAKDIKGKIDYDLIPANLQTDSWKDKEKGLCLLYEFSQDRRFKEIVKEDVEKLKEEIQELSSKLSEEHKKQTKNEESQEIKDEEDITASSFGIGSEHHLGYNPLNDLDNIK